MFKDTVAKNSHCDNILTIKAVRMLLNEKSGMITEVRLTSEGYEYLVMDHDTGVESWFGEADLETLAMV